MKTMPQEMKEEKVEERKAMGMGGKPPVRVALGGNLRSEGQPRSHGGGVWSYTQSGPGGDRWSGRP